MKKIVLSVTALMMLFAALPAKAQTAGTQDQLARMFSHEEQGPAKETCITLMEAAANGSESCVKQLAEKNNYPLEEFFKAFDVATDQKIIDRIYAKALNQMVKDSRVCHYSTDGVTIPNGTSTCIYTIDYKKYYPKDSEEYKKENVRIVVNVSAPGLLFNKKERTEPIRLLKPILNYLMGEARVKKISKSFLLAYEGENDNGVSSGSNLAAVDFAVKPNEAAQKKLDTFKKGLATDAEKLFS